MGFFARLVNFAVGAGHQRFQIAARLRFGGKGDDFSQVGGGAFVKIMEEFQLRPGHPPVRLLFQLVENLFQFGPGRPLGFDEFVQINDHSICLCFTFRYWVTSSALRRSFWTREKWTPRRCRTFSSSRRLCHCRWPPRCSYKSSTRHGGRPENTGTSGDLQHVHQHQMLAADQIHVADKTFRQRRIIQRGQENQQGAAAQPQADEACTVRRNPA